MHKFLVLICCLTGMTLIAQDQPLPEFSLQKEEIRAQMEFLASDILAGRRTGSPGNDVAARYIAAHLEAYGYNSPEGASDYMQEVPFTASTPPQSADMTINKMPLQAGSDFLILSGPAMTVKKATGVFAGYGWVDEETDHDDYAELDVKGKVVFVLPGSPSERDPRGIIGAMKTKRKLAEERGAVALVEMYQMPFPWEMFTSFFGGESLQLAAEDDDEPSKITYAWLNKTDALPFTTIQSAKKLRVNLSSSGFSKNTVYSNNVIGVLEGTDPVLKNEYLLISAHYDHVGVGSQGGQPTTPTDSIFNGARDNAFGTIAMLNAAKVLAEVRPKRSVIVLAVTGEELGLLGSAYYADNPLIPLDEVIFNFNTDGAGYNDTNAFSIIGWGRTGTNEYLETGAKAFNMGIVKDPAPEQNLFDRSDNYSFAKKGVPALCFSPGMSEFNAEILEHYHQVTDNPDSIDYDYLTRYCRAFAHCTRLIADGDKKPVWKAEDKYEAAAKELYGY